MLLSIFLNLIFLLTATKNLSADFRFGNQFSTLQLSGSNAKIILSSPLSWPGTMKILNKSANSIQGTTTSDLLTFSDGVFQSGGNRVYLTGTIDPATTDKIILSSGQSLEAEVGSIIEAVEIRGSGNYIRGQPVFSSAIVMQNLSAVLNLGIQTKLSQNITMNGGTVNLIDDLSLQDGVFFSGNGTVNIGNKTLTLPAAVGSAWTGNLTFQNANDINLTGYTTLNGAWTFTGSGLTSRLNGNGNVLDLSAGGVITVDTNHTLYLTDVIIKGLGTGFGDIAIDSTGGVVNMSNVTLNLSASFEHDSGQIVVQGTNCLLVSRNQYTFNVSGTGTDLTVDGVVFLYDPLGTTPANPIPFVATSPATITYLNDGVIRANSPVDQGNILFSLDSGSGNNLLPNNYWLTATSTISFINSNVATPKDMVLDGQGYFIEFNNLSGQYMILNENITLTLQNVVLKGFDQSLINFQGAGGTKAKIRFGDNVTIFLNKDQTVSSTPLTFVGSSVLQGNGSTLKLTAANALTLTNTKTLTLKDMRLSVGNPLGMHCLHDSSIIKLQDTELNITGTDATFDTGSIQVQGSSKITGSDPSVVAGTSTFTFTTKGTFNVLSGANLKLDRGAKFYYNPDITNDGANPLLEKYHFKLADPSAAFLMESSTLQTGAMGFALAYGRLFIDGKTTFNINTGVGAEVEFGTALQVELGASGVLDIDGALKYISTSYP